MGLFFPHSRVEYDNYLKLNRRPMSSFSVSRKKTHHAFTTSLQVLPPKRGPV